MNRSELISLIKSLNEDLMGILTKCPGAVDKMSRILKEIGNEVRLGAFPVDGEITPKIRPISPFHIRI